MHELGIAQGIIERMDRTAREQNARVTKVGVRIGELSAVDPEALRFGFEVLTKDTPFQDVKLDIEFCRRVQRCRDCSDQFETEAMFTDCPQCGSTQTVMIGGDELDIAYMEVEDPVCA